MLEESLDPRPSFQAVLAALLASTRRDTASGVDSDLARLWDERQTEWVNVRNISHWLERAR